MLVQMRSPFSGRWLKIDAEDGTIVEVAPAEWLDIPRLQEIALQPPRVLRPALHPKAIESVVNEAAP